jgi:adenine-specific DNA glycosylase
VLCPVKRFCAATNPELLPRKKQRPRLKNLVESHAFVIRENEILLEQSRGRWNGMWILPPLKRRKPAVVKRDSFKQSSLSRRPAHTSTFPFTHHRVTLRVFRQAPHKIANDRQRWFPIRALGSIPLPSPHRRALAALLQIER